MNKEAHEISQLTKSPGLLGTVNDLARLMNLTPRRIQQLAREGIIAKTGRGGYDLVRCLAMYITHLTEWRAPAEIPCSIHDLSHYFGLTEGQIMHLVRRGVIPSPIYHGHFDLASSIRGFVAFVHKRGFVSFYGQGSLIFPSGGDAPPVDHRDGGSKSGKNE